MEFGKRHDTTDTTYFLSVPTCYGFAAGKLRGNWCNEFLPLEVRTAYIMMPSRHSTCSICILYTCSVFIYVQNPGPLDTFPRSFPAANPWYM